MVDTIARVHAGVAWCQVHQSTPLSAATVGLRHAPAPARREPPRRHEPRERATGAYRRSSLARGLQPFPAARGPRRARRLCRRPPHAGARRSRLTYAFAVDLKRALCGWQPLRAGAGRRIGLGAVGVSGCRWPVRELVAEIEIAAPAERVWEILTDFGAYRQWNPFMPRFDGEVRVGARLRARLVVAGAPTLRPRLCVTRVDPGRELCWVGRGPLVRGERTMRIQPLDGTRVRFAQRTEFTGPITPLLGWLDRYRPGMQAMNAALKARAEGASPRAGPTRRKAHALALFAGLGCDYDRVGALLSLGQDPRWRCALVARVHAAPGDRVLDVATGTGLVAEGLVRSHGARSSASTRARICSPARARSSPLDPSSPRGSSSSAGRRSGCRSPTRSSTRSRSPTCCATSTIRCPRCASSRASCGPAARSPPSNSACRRGRGGHRGCCTPASGCRRWGPSYLRTGSGWDASWGRASAPSTRAIRSSACPRSGRPPASAPCT